MKKQLIAVPLSPSQFAELSKKPPAFSFVLPQAKWLSAPLSFSPQPSMLYAPRQNSSTFSSWLIAILTGVTEGLLASVLAGLLHVTPAHPGSFWLWLIASLCILPAIAGFITTKAAGRKRAGALAGLIAGAAVGLIALLSSALPGTLSPSSSAIGSTLHAVLFCALIDMLSAFIGFIGAWLATLSR